MQVLDTQRGRFAKIIGTEQDEQGRVYTIIEHEDGTEEDLLDTIWTDFVFSQRFLELDYSF